MSNLTSLRERIGRVDEELLQLIWKRRKLVKEAKTEHGVEIDSLFHQLAGLMKSAKGEQDKELIANLLNGFCKKEPKAYNNEETPNQAMLYSRQHKQEDTIITINGEKIGDGHPELIIGPCAVESFDQVNRVAEEMKRKGIRFLRGGAFKPRTSPYDFQGLGMDGLQILSTAAKKNGMEVVTEIMSESQLEEALPFVDIIQVGARNMQNFSLLKALGRLDKPVLLKRGLSATIDEFKMAAEYILSEGNENVILCERGIRTFEPSTRNTLDISAVPILKQETHLPVIVDVTHSTGRKDLLTATAKAAIAIGADGIMAEVHPDPAVARSDSKQQMDFDEFDVFYNEIQTYIRKNISQPVTL